MRALAIVTSLVVLTACHEDRLVPAYSLVLAEAVTCTTGDFTLQPATPQVMLLLDRSGSMSSTFGVGSRWSTLVSTLELALPPVDAQMQLGLTLFPAASSSGQECVVPDEPLLYPATDQVASVLSALRSTTLVGGTPTALALDVAASGLTGTAPRAIVLATDGLPNCNASLNPATCSCPSASCATAQRCIDDARTLSVLAAHAAEGIPTWVVGIGDDVTSTTILDAMALAGGRPQSGTHRYVAANSSLELQAAFTSIRDELSACSFTSPSVPNTGGTVVLTLDGVTVPRDDTGTSGWLWNSVERGELALRGEWCAKAIAAKSPVVKLSVTCAVESVDVVASR
ncbi:MAG: vWA domain-containing protein [Myxococcaceae bacterium]